MTIKQLCHFQEVCKYKNVTKAAKELYISQPALTTSLKNLEESLGVNLIARNKGKIEITEEGEFFLKKSIELLKHYNKVLEETKDFIDKRKRIKIGLPMQIGVLMLPFIFKDFHNKFEDIKIEIVESGGINTIQRILKEEIQIAITGISTGISKESLEDLNVTPLFKSKICLCVSKNSSLANLKSIKLEEAVKTELVSLGDDFFIKKIIDRECKKLNLVNNPLLVTNQLYTIKTMIYSEIASAFLIEAAISEKDAIIPIPLEENIYVNISLITKKNIQLYKDVKKIKRFILDKFNENRLLESF